MTSPRAPIPGRPVRRRRFVVAAAMLALLAAGDARAIDGELGIHDPSTVAACDGKYYVYGTGGGIRALTSDDGYTWRRLDNVVTELPAAVTALSPKHRGNGVWAPDVIKVGDRYFLYYSVSSWGSFVSGVGVMSNATLDPADPRYKWVDGGPVVNSVEGQDLNAIDPGACLAPDGTLWLCYGSYHGTIQLVQLDPKTGGRITPDSPVSVISSQSEAADIVCRDDWFYLLVNHGSCCQGKNSQYNIRVGRSRTVTGPYLDRHGDDLAKGAGDLFLGASGRQIGPGHFGRLIEGDGVEKFSCHYEADLDKGGRSVLDVRPLLWSADGWPMPGRDVRDGTYQLTSRRTGMTLQVPGRPTTQRGDDGAAPVPGANVTAGRYLATPRETWTCKAAGGGFYTIVNAATGDALTATGDDVKLSKADGSDGQLWKIDQTTDGAYRVAAKGTPRRALCAGRPGQGGRVTLAAFADGGDDALRWTIAEP